MAVWLWRRSLIFAALQGSAALVGAHEGNTALSRTTDRATTARSVVPPPNLSNRTRQLLAGGAIR